MVAPGGGGSSSSRKGDEGGGEVQMPWDEDEGQDQHEQQEQGGSKVKGRGKKPGGSSDVSRRRQDGERGEDVKKKKKQATTKDKAAGKKDGRGGILGGRTATSFLSRSSRSPSTSAKGGDNGKEKKGQAQKGRGGSKSPSPKRRASRRGRRREEKEGDEGQDGVSDSEEDSFDDDDDDQDRGGRGRRKGRPGREGRRGGSRRRRSGSRGQQLQQDARDEYGSDSGSGGGGRRRRGGRFSASGTLARSHARALSPKIGSRGRRAPGGGGAPGGGSRVGLGMTLTNGLTGGEEDGESGVILKTRAKVKEEARARGWVSFCRRKTFLSLGDLPKAEQPRRAKGGACTPFFLHLSKVEGWSLPKPFLARVNKAGHSLRYSLSLSFFHCGSRRFYGNTFVGCSIGGEDDEDMGRVMYNSNATRSRRGKSKSSRASKTKASKAAKRRAKRSAKRRAESGRNRNRWGDGSGSSSDSDFMDGDESDEEDVTTLHDDVAYWYTSFEDPNCIAVVELVATEMDDEHGLEMGKQFGCGWTVIQCFGPNELRAIQSRDVYHGTPRNLLFFQEEDWGSMGESAIPGCSLWFTLQAFDKLLDAKHLIREDEIVSGLDPVPGVRERRVQLPWGGGSGLGTTMRRGMAVDGGEAEDGAVFVGNVLGFKLEDQGGRKRHSRLVPRPLRPQLAPTLTFRLTNLRVHIPGREAFERAMLKHLLQEVPAQEVRQSTLKRGVAALRTTQSLVSTQASDSSAVKSKVLDRRVKVSFHNGHSLVLPGGSSGEGGSSHMGGGGGGDGSGGGGSLGGWVDASLEQTEAPDILMLASGLDALEVGGFVKHELATLVVVVEYTIRTRARLSSNGDNSEGGGGGAQRRRGYAG